jgi:hypothetical protein
VRGRQPKEVRAKIHCCAVAMVRRIVALLLVLAPVVSLHAQFECFHMQREAFLTGEVAENLNSYFVRVLLDRLELPRSRSRPYGNSVP